MAMTDAKHYPYTRTPFPIVYREDSAFKDTYAGATDTVFFEAQLLKPEDRPSNTAIVFMHPIGGGRRPFCRGA